MCFDLDSICTFVLGSIPYIKLFYHEECTINRYFYGSLHGRGFYDLVHRTLVNGTSSDYELHVSYPPSLSVLLRQIRYTLRCAIVCVSAYYHHWTYPIHGLLGCVLCGLLVLPAKGTWTYLVALLPVILVGGSWCYSYLYWVLSRPGTC